MNFASTWDKLFKHCISVHVLLMEVYVQGALGKELRTATFDEHYKKATLERSC